LAKNNPHADETLQAFGMDVGSMGQQINKIRLPWDHAAQEEDALRVRRDWEEEGGDAQRKRNQDGSKERREGEWARATMLSLARMRADRCDWFTWYLGSFVFSSPIGPCHGITQWKKKTPEQWAEIVRKRAATRTENGTKIGPKNGSRKKTRLQNAEIERKKAATRAENGTKMGPKKGSFNAQH
jgi:hypothetical protein